MRSKTKRPAAPRRQAPLALTLIYGTSSAGPLRPLCWLGLALFSLSSQAADIRITQRKSPALLFKAHNVTGSEGFHRDWDATCALTSPGCYVSGNTEICYANPRGGNVDGSTGCYFDVTSTTPGLPPTTNFDQFSQNWITPYSACPAGWIYINSIDACTKDYLYQDNRVCPTENPVFASDGSKKKEEVDFSIVAGGRAVPFKRVFSSFSLVDYKESHGRGWMLEPWGRYLDLRTHQNAAGRVMAIRDALTTLALEKDASGIRRTTPYNGIDLTEFGGGWLLVDTVNGVIELYDGAGRLIKLSYSNGWASGLEYDGANLTAIVPVLGEKIDIGYDSSNRISTVGFGGQLQASFLFYEEYQSVPSAVVFADESTRRYLYEKEHAPLMTLPSETEIVEGLPIVSVRDPAGVLRPTPQFEAAQLMTGSFNRISLTGIIDEESRRFSTYRYDSKGRAIESGLANKAQVRYFDYSSPLESTWVRDGLGNSVEDKFVNVRGSLRLKSRSRSSGSGCEASTSSLDYDTRGNVMSRVDFNGGRTCHAYESVRNFETYRLEGLLGTNTCPGNLASYQVLPGATQRKVSTQWHPEWKLESRRAEPKRITTTVYNDQDDPLTPEVVKASCAPDTAKLSNGSKIAAVCTRYDQSTDDETGNLGFNATVNETRKWSYTYNQYGQVLTETDPRGKVTTYEYWPGTSFAGTGNAARGHRMGDLQRVTNALQQKTEHLEYNKRGQVLTTKYANGIQELREYDPRGWLTKVTLVPAGGGIGQATQYDYYATGLLKQATQPDGSWTFYTWDDAHRLKSVKDLAGNSVEYVLDEMGNRKEEIYKGPHDALAKTITRTFDALGRMDSSKGLQ